MTQLAKAYVGLSKRDAKLIVIGLVIGWAIAMTVAVRWNSSLREQAVKQGVVLND